MKNKTSSVTRFLCVVKNPRWSLFIHSPRLQFSPGGPPCKTPNGTWLSSAVIGILSWGIGMQVAFRNVTVQKLGGIGNWNKIARFFSVKSSYCIVHWNNTSWLSSNRVVVLQVLFLNSACAGSHFLLCFTFHHNRTFSICSKSWFVLMSFFVCVRADMCCVTCMPVIILYCICKK